MSRQPKPFREFQDPFVDIRKNNISQREDKQMTDFAKHLVDLLDNGISNSSHKKSDVSKSAISYSSNNEKEVDYDNYDGNNDEVFDTLKSLSRDDLDSMWEMVEFGRAPSSDYSGSFEDRISHNIERAELAIADLTSKGLKPDKYTWTSYLSVYCEGLKVEAATSLFRSFPTLGVEIDHITYRTMMKMYVRAKMLDKAIELKEEMIKTGIKTDREIHGMLIETYTHREMIVEALKELEEAASKNISVPEHRIRILRRRCKNLGISHPDMPPDPDEWIKSLKDTRKQVARSSQRKAQPIISAVSR
jgi:pentatricopeptide repeat protein